MLNSRTGEKESVGIEMHSQLGNMDLPEAKANPSSVHDLGSHTEQSQLSDFTCVHDLVSHSEPRNLSDLPQCLWFTVLEYVDYDSAVDVLLTIDLSEWIPRLPMHPSYEITWPVTSKRHKLSYSLSNVRNKLHRVQHLRYQHYESPEDLVAFRSLKSLVFTPSFNHPIHSLVFPDTLTSIAFGHDFHPQHLLSPIQWPSSLHTLKLNMSVEYAERRWKREWGVRLYVNGIVKQLRLPSTITQLHLGWELFLEINDLNPSLLDSIQDIWIAVDARQKKVIKKWKRTKKDIKYQFRVIYHNHSVHLKRIEVKHLLETCPNCLKPDVEDYTITPCRHASCIDCAEKWLTDHSNCWYCREELPKELDLYRGSLDYHLKHKNEPKLTHVVSKSFRLHK